MFRKMYQGCPSRKQGPRLAMRDADDEPPRDAPVRPCEWPSGKKLYRAGIKEELNAYLRHADLVSFEEEKCSQYHNVTPSMRLYLPRVEARLRGITALKAMSQVR